MRIPKINLAFLFSGIAVVVAVSLEAQTTFDGFNKSSNSARQKSPQRQLAQRIAPSEQQTDENKQLSVKPAKQAAPQTDSKPASKTSDKRPAPEPISKQRREELMAFVKANHPELQPLLKQLQSKREKQFQAVLRTLDRNVKNLHVLERKSPQRYERALELWGVTSRIQLLSAQLAIKNSEKEKNSIRKKIRSLFEKQFELQREQVALNTEAAKRKYDKFAEQLKALEANRESEIARKLKEIDRTSIRVSAQHRKAAEKSKLEKSRNVNTESSKKQSVPKKRSLTKKAKPSATSEQDKTKAKK